MRAKQGLAFPQKKKERSLFVLSWFIANNIAPYIGIMSTKFPNS